MRLLKINESKPEVPYAISQSEDYSSGDLRTIKKGGCIDSETLQHIEKILSRLKKRMKAKAAAFFTMDKPQTPAAHAGNMGGDTVFPKIDERFLYSGKPVQSAEQYFQPISANNYIIGYLNIQFPDNDSATFDEGLLQTYADLISYEFELAKRKSSLENYSKNLSKKRKELERAREYNDNLLSMTSHDLSSPLNAVSGYLDLMDDCLKDKSEIDRIETYHQRIQSGVQEVMGMLKQLSDINKLERGDASPDMIDVNASWLVREVCDWAESLAIAKDITFARHTPSQPVYVTVDTVKFKRVIQNLISNAIKYTPEGGTITITLDQNDQDALLQVKDTGIGISESHYSEIFNPFVKLENSEAHFSSCGLGLYVASYFTEVMNGEISVQSKENEGSTFTISLPLIGQKMTENRLAI